MLSALLLGGPFMAVHLSPLWPQFSPLVLTKTMKPIMVFFRSQGIHSIIYLNDILLFHCDLHILHSQTTWVIDCLQALGFTINFPKSSVSPDQLIQFLRLEKRLSPINAPPSGFHDIGHQKGDPPHSPCILSYTPFPR